MIGMAVIRKAAKKGYKRYGLPGAVVAGLGTLVGLRFVKRKLGSRGKTDEGQSDESAEQSNAAD